MPISFNSSAATTVLRTLQANQAAKLLLVNTTSLVLPRIYIDYQRNRYAGQETAFYELYSTASNYILPGLVGVGTAHLLASGGNPFKIKTTGWAGNEYVRALSDVYRNALQVGDMTGTRKAFIQSALQQLEGVDFFQRKGQPQQARHLTPQQLSQFTERLDALVQAPKRDAKAMNALAQEIATDLGTFDQVKLRPLGAVGEALNVHPEKLLEYLHSLHAEFQKGYAPALVSEAVQQNVSHIAEKLTRINTAKSWASLGVVAGLGFAAQFINRGITRAQTGKSGFVGYTNFADDISGKPFKPNQQLMFTLSPASTAQSSLKSGLTAASVQNAYGMTPFRVPVAAPLVGMNSGAASFVAANSTAPAVQNAVGQPRFSGGLVSSQFLPTAAQLKYVIYPAGIVGKLLASRCPDEFRETLVKAGFAYINFLLIPNLVENLVAHAFRNAHVFSQAAEVADASGGILGKIKQGFQAINDSKLRSYNDVEVYAKRMGQGLQTLSGDALRQELKAVLGKKADAVMQRLAGVVDAQKAELIETAVVKELNKIKNISAVTGLVYSCLTLGVGLNLLNTKMTNDRQAKRKALDEKAAKLAATASLPFSAPGRTSAMAGSSAWRPFPTALGLSAARSPFYANQVNAPNQFAGAM